jgi:hypothetical protein
MIIAPLLLAFALTTVEVDVFTVPLNGDVRVTLTPAGRVDMKREDTVTRVKVEIERIQPAATRESILNTYVVWAISPEGFVQNLGELAVSGNKGELNATTPLDQLGIIISAEPHSMVDRPNSVVAYRNQPAREELRRMTVAVETGRDDYSKLKPPGSAVNSSVLQARIAFQIAENANAERLAPNEFRNARVALGSMEEMLSRATPLDIFLPAANAAIRWSQRAVAAAREQGAANTLREARSEIETVRAEKQRLESRIAELTQQQSALNEQIRALRNDLVAAGTDKEQLAASRDQAEDRLRSAERELLDAKQKQQELQSRLTLTLRNEFFDNKGLTETGREALIRLSTFADVMAGPLVLQGDVPETSVKSATEFLVLMGVPQDRITRR